MAQKPKFGSMTITQKKLIMIKKWRSRVSIPVPSACKADALPFELHPHMINMFQKKYIRWGSNSRQQSWPELESGALTTRPQMLLWLKYKKINHMAKIKMCSMRGSNPRLLAHKTNTLPTELMELFKLIPAVIKSSKKGCARVEPATYRAATDCSTTELTPHAWKLFFCWFYKLKPKKKKIVARKVESNHWDVNPPWIWSPSPEPSEFIHAKCRVWGSNSRPLDYETNALPTEPTQLLDRKNI